MFEDDDRDIASIIFTLIFIGLVGIAAWRLLSHLPSLRSASIPSANVQSPPQSSPPAASPKSIAERYLALGIRRELFAQWMKEQTDRNADTLLDLLETLSQEARSGMGTYRRVNYDAWLAAKSTTVSRRSIETLADAQFVSWFPKQKGKTLNPRTLGQIWYAIAQDQIRFPPVKVVALNSRQTGTLSKGKGQIYQLFLQPGQSLKLALTPEDDRINLWIFSPNPQTPPILKNSSKKAWTSQVNQSDTYEVVIVPRSPEAVNYTIEFDDARS